MSTTFAGREIEGEVSATAQLAEQHPESEFVEALDRLLQTEGVEAVRWTQYTPYFNDGDPCVFGTHGVEVKKTGDDEGGDAEDGFLDSWSLEKDDPVKAALEEFENVIESDHHDVLLGQKFGDHAQVTATKEKFVIDEYSHD